MNLLEHITIIDFTRLLPGPLATHMLAQMGAKVIKIESPKRMDYARSTGKQIDGATALFHTLNYNKDCRIIDYDTEAGKQELLDLISKTDALIEQFRPGAMDAWGLGYEAVKAINPNIVYLSLTGYGQDGPLKQEAGHDFNYLANAGLMSLLKDERGKPVVPGFQLGDIGGGSYMTVMALLSALLRRASTGEGAFVDVAMTDALLPLLSVPLSLQESGLDPRYFNVLDGKTIVNYGAYECADGKWLSVAALEVKFWNNICELIEKPDWKRKNVMELSVHVFPKAEVEALFKEKSRDEWMAVFEGNDVCIAPILELDEVVNHPHHQARAAFGEMQTDAGTKLKTISLPFKLK
jgi:crotonobetainyl-CoA:carnitine CoA-transferase CaiB-like acyl-CoA transferase